MIETILNNKFFIGIAAAIGSMLLTILVQYLLNKRGRFRYFVWHNRVGVSRDDEIFGSVRVTWNNIVITNLFFSTIELINESMKDYENVEVRVFTTDTHLLTERTEVVETTHTLKWTDKFAERLEVGPDQRPTEEQIALHRRQRDYLIPTMNRGQVIRFTFINSSISQSQPTIWLDVLHKGVSLEFRVAYNKILGIGQPTAALIGFIIGVCVVGIIIINVHTIWLAAIVSFIYGLFAQIPGAFAVKLWRKVKQLFGS